MINKEHYNEKSAVKAIEYKCIHWSNNHFVQPCVDKKKTSASQIIFEQPKQIVLMATTGFRNFISDILVQIEYICSVHEYVGTLVLDASHWHME